MDIRKTVILLKIIMPLLFFSLGIFFILYPEKLGHARDYNTFFGYLLLGYAIFRGFRIWQQLKNENAE